MGVLEGVFVGDVVGSRVIFRVGTADGTFEGGVDGNKEGSIEGLCDCDIVGICEGTAEGKCDWLSDAEGSGEIASA